MRNFGTHLADTLCISSVLLTMVAMKDLHSPTGLSSLFRNGYTFSSILSVVGTHTCTIFTYGGLPHKKTKTSSVGLGLIIMVAMRKKGANWKGIHGHDPLAISALSSRPSCTLPGGLAYLLIVFE